MSLLRGTALALALAACDHPRPAPTFSSDLTTRICPSEISAGACTRYRYFMAATDALFGEMPKDGAARKQAVAALDPVACQAAANRLIAWAAAHTDDLATIEKRLSPLTIEEQQALRYGRTGQGILATSPRRDLEEHLTAMQDLGSLCGHLRVDVLSPLRSAGIDTPSGWQDGVLDMPSYKPESP